MKKPFTSLLLCLVWVTFLTLAAPLHADTESDQYLQSLKPAGLVNDYANVFTSAQKSSLESLLQELKQKSSAQIAVAAIRSTKGVEIDDFANRLFEQWGIGQKGKDNGILLLAAIEDRKARIEVGYGLEGAINDALAGRILRADVFPSFKQGNYANGLTQGAVTLASLVAKEAGITLSGNTYNTRRNTPRDGRKPSLLGGIFQFILLIGFVIFAIRHPFLALLLLSGGRGGGFRGGGFGGGGGGFGGGMSGGGGASGGW